MFSLAELHAAKAVVGAAMPPTPQFAWPLLAERLEAEVWVKHENHTPTGAFKVRGGLTYLDRLVRDRPTVQGLIAATRGNHGQSLAFAGRRYGRPITLVAPHGNSAEKNAAMRALGATLIEHGTDFQSAREEAERLALEWKLEMGASFHHDLVLGVATYAFEFLMAAPDLEIIYVAIGLGSGICGCILVRDLLGLKTEIVGVQSTEAPAYALSVLAGRVISTPTSDTWADGIATRLPDPEALEIIRRGATRVLQVTDTEIAVAMRAYWTDTHNLSEGAGAAALAGLLQERDRSKGRKIGVVLSGGNIDFDLFWRWTGLLVQRKNKDHRTDQPSDVDHNA